MLTIHRLAEQDSVLNQFLAEIRSVDIQRDPLRFRQNIRRIGWMMAHDISRALNYHTIDVTTPLGTASVSVPEERIVLGTIMRAGLPLHEGFLDVFDHAENAFISAYRRAGRTVNGVTEVEIVSEYLAAPDVEGKTLILVDPMLATGQSMEVALRAVLGSHGTPKHVHLAAVIACEQALQYLEANLPKGIDIDLWCAAVDPVLNEHKYIVPGLGDAGDLCFGDKL